MHEYLQIDVSSKSLQRSKISIYQCKQASQKPIIFHNGMYDILFLYHNLESSLPEDLQTFKEDFHRRITNKIFDTKIPSDTHMTMKYRDQIPFSSLEEMTKFVKASYSDRLLVDEVLNVQNVYDDVIAGKVSGVAMLKSSQRVPKAVASIANGGSGSNQRKDLLLGGGQPKEEDFKFKPGEGGQPTNSSADVPTKFHDAGYDALQTGRLFAALRECENV